MPLIGGAGNPVGGSFTGPAEALEIIGDHAYAMNRRDLDSDTATWFEFTTGNFYFVGTLGGGRLMKSNAETTFFIEYNDVIVFESAWDNGADETLIAPMNYALPLIIPSYTKVQVYMTTTDHDRISLSLTGRIYRG